MRVAAYYLASIPYDSNSGTPPEVQIRVHTSEKALGDQAGTSLNSAERIEQIPKVICWVADLAAAGVTLARNAVFSVEAGEAWQIDHIEPRDRETITVHCSPLDAEDSAGLPYPDG